MARPRARNGWNSMLPMLLSRVVKKFSVSRGQRRLTCLMAIGLRRGLHEYVESLLLSY